LYSEKQKIRKQMLLLRDGMTREEVEFLSKEIIDRVYSMQQFKESNLIMSYVNFRNEVKTVDFIDKCISLGKKVAVPKIVDTGEKRQEIIAVQITGVSHLAKGKFGILEPGEKNLAVIDPSCLDFIVVPGIAFDLNKNRLGFGKGFYDRFLSRTNTRCIKVGLAYEMQIIESLPFSHYDIPLDFVVTEKRML